MQNRAFGRDVADQAISVRISEILTTFDISLFSESLPQGCTSGFLLPRRICTHLGFFLRTEGERTQVDMKRGRTV